MRTRSPFLALEHVKSQAHVGPRSPEQPVLRAAVAGDEPSRGLPACKGPVLCC